MLHDRRLCPRVDGAWDAVVRIRRVLSEDTCRKVAPGLAERWALIWAKRWVDLREEDRAH
jgi:hypothetical protein